MDNIKKTRTFVAVEIEKSIREKISRISDDVSKKNRDIRPVPPQNIHLTLKFLGDRTEKEIRKISESVSKAASGKSSFKARMCKNLDAFPNKKRARVLIFKFLSHNKKIINIFEDMQEQLLLMGIKKEKRKFIPHITIARSKKFLNIESISEKDLFDKNLEIYISNVTIFSSSLKNTGAQYSIIERFDLK